MNKAICITVTGTVQGVFYRKYTQQQAQQLNITGHVRNEPNGTVTIEAEGAPEALQKFAQWCKTGSPSSTVETVETKEIPPKGHTQFQIY